MGARADMAVRGGRFLVVGLGKTGEAVSRFLARRGARVTATDLSCSEKIACADELRAMGVTVAAGGHREADFTSADTVILSPGVPPDIAPVRAARAAGAEVTGEAEFAFRLSGLPVVAVTGSNGKTTTTGLIAAILRRCGRRPFVGGNFGTPFINAVENERDYDLALLEMSSFQLKNTSAFSPLVAVVLNVSPNHLDAHPDYADYVDSKRRIFANQTPKQWAVANGGDSEAAAMLGCSNARKVIFDRSVSRPQPGLVTARGRTVFFNGESYDLSGSNLEGAHNLENCMAAVAVAAILGCDPALTAQAVREFRPPPHRMEFVREIGRARVYDDSKATNPAATARALESLAAPVVLISGGKDKKTGYAALRPLVEGKVSSLVLFGESRAAMRAELGGLAKTFVAASLEDAVRRALSDAEPGGSVLFSPACSSFDMFSSFEERGREFKRIVRTFK